VTAMNFANRIRELAARQAEAEPGENRFLSLLRQVEQGLSAEGRAVARLEQGAHPRRYHLTLHPRHRPSQRHLMLTFWVEPNRVVVSGEESQSFDSPEGLEKRLEQFVASPAFQESLAELARVAEEPVEAYLRALGSGALSREDVMVGVAAADQARLDEAAEGDELRIVVSPIRFPGAGQLDPTRNYVALDSAGLSMTVEGQQPGAAGGLDVRGRKRGA
jgi:hypothetical protein